MSRAGKVVAALIAVAGLVAMPASPALAAGTYVTHLGQAPDGSPAPAGPWTGGATYGSLSGGPFGKVAAPGAGPGWTDGLSLSLGGMTVSTATAWRSWIAPISSGTAQPAIYSTFDGWHGNPYDGCVSNAWGACGGYAEVSSSGVVSVSNPSSLDVIVACNTFGAGGGTCWPGASWWASRIDLTVADATPPTGALDAAGGPLMDGSWQTVATRTLPFTAADAAGGVYRAFWREGGVTRYVALSASATCRTAPGAGTTYEFLASTTSLVPCPRASASYAPSFDLAALGDGTHTGVDLGLEDAAGNERLLATNRTIRINAPGSNPGPGGPSGLPDPGTPCTNGTYDASGTCVARPPANTSLPSLSGTPAEGGTLTTDDGAWNDVTGATYGYGWELCDAAGSACTPIPGETGSSIAITPGMVGHTVRSVVTATTSGGATSSTSSASYAIGSTGGGGSGGAGGITDVVAEEAQAGGGSGGKIALTRKTADALPMPPVTVYVTANNGRRPDGLLGDDVRIDATRAGATTRALVYGETAAITGRLTLADGTPIPDAQVDVIVHDAVKGAQGRVDGKVTTDDRGGFTYTPRPCGSRIFTFGYRLRLSDDHYARWVSVAVPVATPLSLAVSKTRLRNGQTVTLTGRVTGAPASSGKVVDVQVQTGGRWTTFATTRIRNGRFTYRYRFTRTAGTHRYAFRTRVSASSDWPMSTGTSPTRSVTVTGPKPKKPTTHQKAWR